jgi:hypothetical protein
MSSSNELTSEISRRADLLAAQLAAHERELESIREQEGRAFVRDAREAIERLLRDLHAR